MKNCALITAAGKSRRMGSGIKKEFLFIDKQRVLEKTLEAFLKADCFFKIAITLPQESIEECADFPLIKQQHDKIILTAGAQSRQASVFAGLQALKEFQPDHVLIHDGARPYCSIKLIREVLNTCRHSGACIPVRPLSEALKKIDSAGNICGHLDRSSFASAQTPQGFDFNLIYQAHQLAAARQEDFQDDAQVFALLGKTVSTVRGEKANIKITYPEDLA